MKRFGKHIMIGCKESTLLSVKKLEESLSLSERLANYIHFLYCKPCLRFSKQIKKLNRSLHGLAKSKSVMFSEEKKKDLEEMVKNF